MGCRVGGGQGQDMELQREAGVGGGGMPSGLDVLEKRCAVAWQGSILSREQLCKHDSRGQRGGGEGRDVEAQEEAATPERLRGEAR